MGIRVERLEHGDMDMWLALGPFFCDRSVVKDLGGPIYSAPGVSWFVARQDNDEVVGFASLREANGVLWYDYAYVAPASRGKGVFGKLSKERDKQLRRDTRPRRAVMPLGRWPHYEKRGWTILSTRGSWVTVEKTSP